MVVPWGTLNGRMANPEHGPVSSPPPVSGTNGTPSTPPVFTNGPTSGDAIDLRAPSLYLNRELSWLEFNTRVLAEAASEAVPLLERLKFHAIVASNLDEFFMVRVAGLKQQLTGEVGDVGPDGLTPHEQLVKLSAKVHDLVGEQMANLMGQLLPRLASDGTFLIVKPEQLAPAELAVMDQRFHDEVFPILTPIAIDPGHPFPHLRNKSLNLGVMFSREGQVEPGFGVVQVPMMLPRLLEVSGGKGEPGRQKHVFVLLEDLIARHCNFIFPGVKMKGVYSFRVTRNFDIEIDEEEARRLAANHSSWSSANASAAQRGAPRNRGRALDTEFASSTNCVRVAKARSPSATCTASTACSTFRDFMQLGLAQRRPPRPPRRRRTRSARASPAPRYADDIFAVIREGKTCSYITRTNRSTPLWSWCRAPPKIPTCSPSSKRSIANRRRFAHREGARARGRARASKSPLSWS